MATDGRIGAMLLFVVCGENYAECKIPRAGAQMMKSKERRSPRSEDRTNTSSSL